MGIFFNEDKKEYIGQYKGISCWSFGCMIGNNWYGTYYCTKRKNGRNYKVKDSVSGSVKELKDYIDRNIEELKFKRKVLKIYWDDDVTVEQRYFDTQKDAEDYVKREGIINYAIEDE